MTNETFNEIRAERADAWAAYWEKQGDKDQVERFRAEAASLRKREGRPMPRTQQEPRQ